MNRCSNLDINRIHLDEVKSHDEIIFMFHNRAITHGKVTRVYHNDKGYAFITNNRDTVNGALVMKCWRVQESAR